MTKASGELEKGDRPNLEAKTSDRPIYEFGISSEGL
jgi:hypothetical protein